MLKSDLILAINKKYNSLNPNDIELIFKLFFKKITEGLKEGNNIEIRGFGTFSKKINKEKMVRNPKTNEKFFKKENYKVHFKAGKILNKRINLK
jgi:nucleoid DNA-binding protein